MRENWRKAAREGELEREREGERGRTEGRLGVGMSFCVAFRALRDCDQETRLVI